MNGTPLVALALALAPAPALAATQVLKIANFDNAGHVVAEFVTKEVAAVVLQGTASDYPMRVLAATVRVGVSAFGTHTGTGKMRLWIWRDTGAAEPGAVLYQGPSLVDVQTGENTVDLRAAGIVIDQGPVRVGFEIGVEGADPLVDDDGVQGRNWVLGKQAGTADTFRWQPLPGFLAGDFLISLLVETNVGDGGAAADAGVPPADAGATADAGMQGSPDAGTAGDAGTPPPSDGGSTPAVDAGARGDGGVVKHPSGGCVCGLAGGPPGGLAFAIALALGFARRRRS